MTLQEITPGKESSRRLQDKQAFVAAVEQEYRVICGQVIDFASSGWQYCLGLDWEFIDPSLQATRLSKQQDDNPSFILSKAPYTASEYLQQILNISDIRARWQYVCELVYTQNDQLLADNFSDLDLSDSIKKALCGPKLNILILGAGCVGLAFANALQTALGEAVNILMIENRTQAKHIKKPYTRDWLTYIPNAIYQDFLDPRVIKILSEFGNGYFMGVSLNVLETLLFLSNRAQGTQFYFDDHYDLSFISDTDIDIIVDATGGNITYENEWDTGSFAVNLAPFQQYGSRFSGFGITNFDDLPMIPLTLVRKGSAFYPTFAETQLKAAMFKLTNVPLELYDTLVAYARENNSDSLIYIWPGTLRAELNSLLILINLSASDYQQVSQLLPQKIDLHSFVTKHSNDLKLDQRILDLFQKILEGDINKSSKLEPPFLYEPYVYLAGETLPRIAGRPVLRIGDSVFNGHPKVGNGLGSHLVMVGKLHDLVLSLSRG